MWHSSVVRTCWNVVYMLVIIGGQFAPKLATTRPEISEPERACRGKYPIILVHGFIAVPHENSAPYYVSTYIVSR